MIALAAATSLAAQSNADFTWSKKIPDGGRLTIRSLNGPIEVPSKRWIARCADPQGAVFALTGKRAHDEIGYFERVGSRQAAGARGGETNR